MQFQVTHEINKCMSTLAKIIRYFSSHDFADNIRLRVWSRLGKGTDDDAETALQDVWQANAPGGELARGFDKKALDRAFGNVAEKAGMDIGEERGIHWERILLRAAIWIVPLVMLGGAWLFYRAGVEERNALADTSFVQVFCGNGDVKKLLLPDSTEVWLNSGSVLVYPSRFSGGGRNVTLIGEAFFKVRHIDGSPFQVSVNHLQVKDIGTSFNVQCYPNFDQTCVTLKEGVVSVNDGHGDYRLSPNQQLVYSNRTGHVDIDSVDASEYVAWSAGEIQFNDEPLPVVLKKYAAKDEGNGRYSMSSDDQLLFPIPFSEINRYNDSKVMWQNPGY